MMIEVKETNNLILKTEHGKMYDQINKIMFRDA